MAATYDVVVVGGSGLTAAVSAAEHGAAARALDGQGQPITGLCAVGQNGAGGQVLWGHGLHIAWAMTSGRIVGRQLARGRGRWAPAAT